MHTYEVWHHTIPKRRGYYDKLIMALGSPNITDDKSPYLIGQDNQTHNEESVLNEAGHIINNLLHEESKKLSSAK